jgi:hypothetical protein
MAGASGPNFVIPATPVYDNQIPSFADTDPIWATGVVNPVLLQIIINIEALRQSGGTIYQATIPTSAWTPGPPTSNGTFWFQCTITDARIAAPDVIYMLPADGDSAVQVAEYLRGFVDTFNGGITLYAIAVPDAPISVFYAINKGVV